MTIAPISRSVPYSKLRPQLGTGDLFFLHGTSGAGVMIEMLEEVEGWPPYSHVGMVIRDGDDLYFWDAPGGGDCFPDPYTTDPDNREYGESVHTGCRVAVLDDVLAYYATKVDQPGFWARQLKPAVSKDRFLALRRFINRVDGLPFPEGPRTGAGGHGARFQLGPWPGGGIGALRDVLLLAARCRLVHAHGAPRDGGLPAERLQPRHVRHDRPDPASAGSTGDARGRDLRAMGPADQEQRHPLPTS